MKTIPWSPYYKTDITGNLSVTKCAVCGGYSESYLTNTYYCGRHGDLALRRDAIVHSMIKDANEKGGNHTDELFRQQPDLRCHAKWIRILEGYPVEYNPPYQRCELPDWAHERYGLPRVKDCASE